MGRHPASGTAEATSGLSASVSIRHTGGWPWESRWLLVTKYLLRLQEIYDGAPIESNTDLWAVTNSFVIDAYHLGETFSHQLSLHKQVALTLANSPELQICRDYTNTWKHFYRDKNVRVAYIWEDGASATGGHYVTIAYRLRDEAVDRQETIDALELAFAAGEGWREFMVRNSIAEPAGLTQQYLDKLNRPHNP